LLGGDAAARGIEPLAAAEGGATRAQTLQRLLDPECHHCADDLAQLGRFDRLGAALDQNVAEDNRSLVAELCFPGCQFVALFPELLQGIDRIVLAGHVSPFRPLGLWSLENSSATAPRV
jgi:hypothetical protein